jgi:hypothetical protein
MTSNRLLTIALIIIAVCLAKLAFMPGNSAADLLIPRAFAQGGAIPWQDGNRIVTVGDDGATTYIWDYDDKTKVRKYSVKNDKLTLESIQLFK